MNKRSAMRGFARFVPSGASTIHFTFCDSGAGNLRAFFGGTGRREGIVTCGDNYGVGPIDPPDPTLRREWADRNAPSMPAKEHRWILGDAEAFWDLAKFTKRRRIVWVSRRDIREFCGFLEWVWRLDRESYEVIDITEAEASWQDSGAAPMRAKVESLGWLNPDHVDMDALFAQAATPTAAEVAHYREKWRRLRVENAPLRILRGLEIVSTEVTYYDELLLSFATMQWRPDIKLIGDMVTKSDVRVERDVTFDFLQSRIWVLVDKGRLEGRRGPKPWQGSVRLVGGA